MEVDDIIYRINRKGEEGMRPSSRGLQQSEGLVDEEEVMAKETVKEQTHMQHTINRCHESQDESISKSGLSIYNRVR